MQPENYLKAAEQTTEQNYNMIDGQINNTPTATELEEKQKPEDRFPLQNTPKPSKQKRNRQSRRKVLLSGRSLKQRKNRHRRNRQDRKHRIWKGADL